MMVSIFFHEANGIEWYRDKNGLLEEAKDYKELLRTKRIFPPY